MNWRFPNPNRPGSFGATVMFRHMENPDDRFAWLGAGVPLICFDELASFMEDMFFFMLGSNRSTCGVRPYIRCTTNPDSKSWVARFIEWWIDQDTGYPIKDRAGKLRWFCRVKDRMEWADDPYTLMNKHPGVVPKSVTFIPAKVYDNKILMQQDPGYLSNLMALPYVDRERYLGGNWKISEAVGTLFRREWFKIIPEAPADLTQFVRYWDLAATDDSDGGNPDWTCGMLMSFKNGQWIILDVQRLRGTPKVVEERIAQTAKIDPQGTAIRMEQEPGASGKIVIDHYARNILPGRDFKELPSRRKKLLRWKPFSAAAEHGNVLLVQGRWNSTFLDEAEIAKGGDEKNDQIDCGSGCIECLQESFGDWRFALPVGVRGYQSLGFGPSTGRYKAIGSG